MSLENKDRMLNALAHEIEERKGYLNGETITTLYFGGGTPTVCTPTELQSLIETVKRCHPCQLEEITVEANPDDLSPQYLQQLKAIGVNRLSIGIQSFIERDLALMNRRHNAQMAQEVVPMAKAAGFTNITIDLIYGIPGQTEAEWKQNLTTALSLDVPHISSYHLSIEPKTVFGNRMKRGLFHPVDDELSERLYILLEQMLTEAGYEHYEVSNFAKPGCYSKHNTSYWTYVKYVGVGPSAHSFNGTSRQWNVANNVKYLSAIESGTICWEKENMSPTEQYNEFILTSLRTVWGIDKNKLKSQFQKQFIDYFYTSIESHLNKGTLVDNGTNICIPGRHFLISDGIMSDLFFVEN